MPDIQWVKLTTDMFDNRKIKHIRRLPEGNNIVLIWIMLLTMAGRCNAGGMIFLTENIPYTTKMLADELDFEESTVKLALEALERLGMVVYEKGFFMISGWAEHQNIEGMDKIREQNRLRKAAQRERAKEIPEICEESRDSHVTGNVTSRDCHAIDKNREDKKRVDKIREDIYSSDAELNAALISFIEFRKSIHKPLTKKGIELNLKKLREMSDSIPEQVEIINQSIANGWQGLFPLKKETVTEAAKPAKPTAFKETAFENDTSHDDRAILERLLGGDKEQPSEGIIIEEGEEPF